MLALLDLGRPHFGRSLVKLASIARTEFLLSAYFVIALVCLLGLLCVHYWFFFLCSAWLDRLRLARALARTDLDLTLRLLRRLSLPDLLGFLLPPNFYGGPLRGPP